MIHFSEADRQKWLAFLGSPEGRNGIAYLRESKRPTIRSASQPHEMHFDLGSQQGFDLAIEEVEKLARMPQGPTPQTADRPSLISTRRP